jgi:hypothetical protein
MTLQSTLRNFIHGSGGLTSAEREILLFLYSHKRHADEVRRQLVSNLPIRIRWQESGAYKLDVPLRRKTMVDLMVWGQATVKLCDHHGIKVGTVTVRDFGPGCPAEMMVQYGGGRRLRDLPPGIVMSIDRDSVRAVLANYPVSHELVREFESRHGVLLPGDMVRFLTRVPTHIAEELRLNPLIDVVDTEWPESSRLWEIAYLAGRESSVYVRVKNSNDASQREDVAVCWRVDHSTSSRELFARGAVGTISRLRELVTADDATFETSGGQSEF